MPDAPPPLPKSQPFFKKRHLTMLKLFGVGALLSLFTGRSAWHSGARMLALGGLAGGITYAIGRLAGIAIG